MFLYILLTFITLLGCWWCIEAHLTRHLIARWERDMEHQISRMEAWQTSLERLEASLHEPEER